MLITTGLSTCITCDSITGVCVCTGVWSVIYLHNDSHQAVCVRDEAMEEAVTMVMCSDQPLLHLTQTASPRPTPSTTLPT